MKITVIIEDTNDEGDVYASTTTTGNMIPDSWADNAEDVRDVFNRAVVGHYGREIGYTIETIGR